LAVSKEVMAIGLIVVAVVAFAAGLFASPYVIPPEEKPETMWDVIQQRGTIKIGSSPDWPPYEYLNLTTGEFIGFEVELMETIAERLNLTVEWIEMSFATIIEEVKAKTIDMGISGFSVRPDRLEVVQFTMYHSITEGQIIMLQSRRDALGITEIDSLEELDTLGLSCGAQDGTTQQEELSEEAPGALRTYADYILALADMKRRAIDSVYAETPITTEWIYDAQEKGEPPLVVVYRRSYYPVAFAVHQDNDILVQKINAELAEMIGSGELDALKKKWRC